MKEPIDTDHAWIMLGLAVFDIAAVLGIVWLLVQIASPA